MKNFKILCRAGEILKFYAPFARVAYIRPRISLASVLYTARSRLRHTVRPHTQGRPHTLRKPRKHGVRSREQRLGLDILRDMSAPKAFG